MHADFLEQIGGKNLDEEMARVSQSASAPPCDSIRLSSAIVAPLGIPAPTGCTGTFVHSLAFVQLSTVKCPFCGMFIYRSSGCPHMHCQKPAGCDKHFCYDCGGKYDAGGHHTCKYVSTPSTPAAAHRAADLTAQTDRECITHLRRRRRRATAAVVARLLCKYCASSHSIRSV